MSLLQTFFHAMPARYDATGTVGTKWIGTALNAALGLPHINAMIVLSDIETAVIKSVMDGTVVTAIRPAAVSLVAARRLARPDSSRISFYPCGVQARAHLDAFATEFPIRDVTCYSRTIATAEAFAVYARERGFSAAVVTDARRAVQGQDIIVSSAPRAAELAKVLDPTWLSQGAFVTGVDLGRAWRCQDLRQLELLATDNHIQSREARRPAFCLGLVNTMLSFRSLSRARIRGGQQRSNVHSLFIRGSGLAILRLGHWLLRGLKRKALARCLLVESTI